MKEFRFKVLLAGEKLCYFNGKDMLIKTTDNKYKIYKVEGFFEGRPIFCKKSKTVDLYDFGDICENILCLKFEDEYKFFKYNDYILDEEPSIDKDFVLVVKSGIGKIERFDSESQLTINIPAKESIDV